jgi:hypothetical protein
MYTLIEILEDLFGKIMPGAKLEPTGDWPNGPIKLPDEEGL